MAKIVILLLLFTSSSCINFRTKSGTPLDGKMENTLSSSIEDMSFYLESNDPVFASLKKNVCLDDWSMEVGRLKKELQDIKKKARRGVTWFELGNCYAIVGKFAESLYYYDLSLGEKNNDNKVLSILHYNMGQIFELKGQIHLSRSFYLSSVKQNYLPQIALFKLALLEYYQSEFKESNKYLSQLQRYVPSSKLVRYLQGVNFFHLGHAQAIKDKVLILLDEKSSRKVLLTIAIDLLDGRANESRQALLSDLDVQFKFEKQFKNYLLEEFGR